MNALPRLLLCAATTAAVVFAPGSLVAASSAADADDASPQIESVTPGAGLDIDFPGGTMGELLDRLTVSKRPQFNLILTSSQRDLVLPAFNVRNASVWSLANALSVLLQAERVAIHASARLPAGTDPVFTLQPTEPPAPKHAIEGKFKSYRLGELSPPHTPEQVAGALRAAWELDPAHDPAALKIKFHPESGLLFIVGPDNSAIAIADQVLNSFAESRVQRVTDEIARRRAMRRDSMEESRQNSGEPTPQSP